MPCHVSVAHFPRGYILRRSGTMTPREDLRGVGASSGGREEALTRPRCQRSHKVIVCVITERFPSEMFLIAVIYETCEWCSAILFDGRIAFGNVLRFLKGVMHV